MAALKADERAELERLRNLAQQLERGVEGIIGPKKEIDMGSVRTTVLGAKHTVKAGFRGIKRFFKDAAVNEQIELQVEKEIAEQAEEARKRIRQAMKGGQPPEEDQ